MYEDDAKKILSGGWFPGASRLDLDPEEGTFTVTFPLDDEDDLFFAEHRPSALTTETAQKRCKVCQSVKSSFRSLHEWEGNIYCDKHIDDAIEETKRQQHKAEMEIAIARGLKGA